MSDYISREAMSETPDEIKKSLRMCTEHKCAPSCLYYEVETGCCDALMKDALDYIERLENRVKTDKE